MATNNFSFYVPKNKRQLLSLCNELSLDNELSNFVVEALEMHHSDLIQKRVDYHRSQVEYWKSKQLRTMEYERLQDERLQQEHLAPWIRKCKVVEEMVNQLVAYEKVDPDYIPKYDTLVAQIRESGGPNIEADTLKRLYDHRTKGEVINYLEELMPTGGSE